MQDHNEDQHPLMTARDSIREECSGISVPNGAAARKIKLGVAAFACVPGLAQSGAIELARLVPELGWPNLQRLRAAEVLARHRSVKVRDALRTNLKRYELSAQQSRAILNQLEDLEAGSSSSPATARVSRESEY